MNTELLRRILDDAREAAPNAAHDDAIRVLMLELGLTHREHANASVPSAWDKRHG